MIYKNASNFYNEMVTDFPMENHMQSRQRSSFLKYLTDKSVFDERKSKQVPTQRTSTYDPLTDTERVYHSVAGEKPKKKSDSIFTKNYETMVKRPNAFRKSSGDFEKSIDNKNVLQKFLRDNKSTIEKEDDDE